MEEPFQFSTKKPIEGMSFDEKIDASFDDPAVRSQADSYVADVIANWREAESGLKRTVFLTIVLIVLFELTRRQGVREVSLLGVSLSDSQVIVGIIPLVVAYLINNTLYLVGEVFFFAGVYSAVMWKLYKPLARSNLHIARTPANSIIYGQVRIAAFTKGPGAQLVLGTIVISFVLRLLLILGVPIGFEIYAYRQLLLLSTIDTHIVFASIVLAVLLIVNGLSLAASLIIQFRAVDRS